MDAGFDGGYDAGFDGGVDAGFDGGYDAGFDGGYDAGFDGGYDAGYDAGYDGGFDAGPTVWDFGEDFRVDPNQENPSQDSHGNADTWSYRFAATGDQASPAQHDLLPDFNTGDPNRWQYAAGMYGVPHVGVRPSPEGEVHPGNPGESHEVVVVRWTSPVAGTVQVSGAVTDWDNGGGDGIEWWLYAGPSGSVSQLGSGSFDNGGNESLGSHDVTVAVGDYVYLAVGPRTTSLYDTTEVDLTITLP
jgi:hypothetical protein